jgi:EAL domain-containing protein (putative c-di-GMP-specific phosphodiesterase class I)
LFVNVNISGQDLSDIRFADFVNEVLDRHGLPPSSLTLEITEGTLMHQLEAGSKTLTRLHELGVGLSVDDFGTGYSSLSHLSRLPISSLKIDRSFVGRMEGESDDSEIVRALIQLGAVLGIRVVAEGIETEVQLESLRNFGCAYGQGYFLARPLTVDQVEPLLEAAPAPAQGARRDAGAGAESAQTFRLPVRSRTS